MSYTVKIDLTDIVEKIKEDLKIWINEVIRQKIEKLSDNNHKPKEENNEDKSNSELEGSKMESKELQDGLEEENNTNISTTKNVDQEYNLEEENNSEMIVVDGSNNPDWDYFHKHYRELKIVKLPDPRVLHMKEFKLLCRKLLEVMPNHVVVEFNNPKNKIYYNLKNKIAAKAMYEKLNQIIFRSRRVIHEYIPKDRTNKHIKIGLESIEVLKDVIKEHSPYFVFR